MENSFLGSLEISFLLLFPLLRNTLNYQGHQEIMDKVLARQKNLCPASRPEVRGALEALYKGISQKSH